MNGGKEMLKKILFVSIFAITAIATVAHAESDLKTVASKAYVDTQIETKQLKIPAANTPGIGAGETVMTYTATGNGQIGERGLYSDISSYDATTDGDKLITASALNATFTNLPTTPTTKLECANQADGCTLWTIVDQTAYRKPSKNLFDGTVYNIAYLANPNRVAYNVLYRGIIVPVTAGNQYTISRQTAIGNRFTWFFTPTYPQEGDLVYNISSTTATSLSATVTVPNGMSFLVVYFDITGSDILPSKIQVELGNTATSYEPYY